MAGSLPRYHLRCVQPCGRVCLPENVFVELVKAKGGPETLACTYVRAWHQRVCETWDAETGPRGSEPIGDDKYAFWRARWAEDHGTTKAEPKPARQARSEPTYTEWVCPHAPPCPHSLGCRQRTEIDEYKAQAPQRTGR